MADRNTLTDEERAIYEWQLWVEGFGTQGQLRLKPRGHQALVDRVRNRTRLGAVALRSVALTLRPV